jgi:hypothetical protein
MYCSKVTLWIHEDLMYCSKVTLCINENLMCCSMEFNVLQQGHVWIDENLMYYEGNQCLEGN